MSKIRVETYFKNEIMNYEEQDKKAGRDVEDVDYVDVEFLMNLMNTQCENCNEPLVIDFEDGRISSNVTCQRVNNEQSHFKDNCIGLCVQCKYMSNKQKIISDIDFDRSGYGSRATSLKDAREKDKTITMKDVEYFFRKNVEIKRKHRVRTVL